jgi:hypothetical protein
MIGLSRRPARHSRKSKTARGRLLRSELLEPRAMLSGHGISSSPLEIAGPGPLPIFGAAKVTNAPPIVTQAIIVNGNAAVTGKTAAASVLGSDPGGSKLVYNWSVTSAPAGGFATFGVNGASGANLTTVTFTEAGTYALTVRIVDAGGLSVSTSKTVVVAPTLTSLRIKTAGGQLLSPGSSLVVPGVSQALVASGLDQFGNAMAVQPSFTWSTATVPAGASQPTLAAGGGGVTVAFHNVGTYGLAVKARTAAGVSVAASVLMVVTPQPGRATVASIGSTAEIAGKTVQFSASQVDQFGNAMAGSPTLVWSATAVPLNASAPTFTTGGNVTTVAFAAAGAYTLSARTANAATASFTTMVLVDQTLTSIAVSPNTASVVQGATQQFTAQALDQFLKPMLSQPTFAWTAGGGSVTGSGLFTAPGTAGSLTVTAKSGSTTGTATVTVPAKPAIIQNTTVAALVQQLDADGSISRNDMIQILRGVAAAGTVTATEFSDLKQMLSQAASLNIPGYVQALAGDVINGNAANSTFGGQPLGNLAVGSSGAQLTELVNKWFLGADHPALCNTSLVYTSVAGSLFPHTPSHNDEVQGALGDCYFISALGTLADSNPAAVRNMFIDNGDGTCTVRFYTGTYGTIYNYSNNSIGAGFTQGVGTADYVTVDCMLPTSASGMLVYADYGASASNAANSLWIPLAEKAYAQWNQTGKEGRDGANAYASIQGGWMATVDAQVLGYNATDWIMTTTKEQVAIAAIQAGQAVTIGTGQWSGTVDGLYASHAYAIIGYNAGADTFTLYNPWGSNQPGQLTWRQLQADTTQLCVAATSGTVPISGAPSRVASGKVLSPNGLSGGAAAMLSRGMLSPRLVDAAMAY